MNKKISFKLTWKTLTAGQKRQFAELFGSSVAHLSNVANGHKKPSDRFQQYLDLKYSEFYSSISQGKRTAA